MSIAKAIIELQERHVALEGEVEKALAANAEKRAATEASPATEAVISPMADLTTAVFNLQVAIGKRHHRDKRVARLMSLMYDEIERVAGKFRVKTSRESVIRQLEQCGNDELIVKAAAIVRQFTRGIKQK